MKRHSVAIERMMLVDMNVQSDELYTAIEYELLESVQTREQTYNDWTEVKIEELESTKTCNN